MAIVAVRLGKEMSGNEDDLSFSFSDDIEVFPSSVVFKPTFPNVLSHFTLCLCNPRADPIMANLRLDSSNFRINSKMINIGSGSVCSLIVTFESPIVGDFQAILHIAIENEPEIPVPLRANCIDSPLLIPTDDISQFKFSSDRRILTSRLANRSLSKSLRVLFDVDTSSFHVSPPSVDLLPFAECPIEISYQGSALEHDPHFLVQCEDSGDSALIPLQIDRSRLAAVVDFGVVPVGDRSVKSLCLPAPEKVPDLDAPFSVHINQTSEVTDEFLFQFISERVGPFTRVADFGNASVTLKAEAVALPFAVEMGECEMEPITITNTTKEQQSYRISFSENFDRHHATKVRLGPSESQNVDITNAGDSLYFNWKVNGKNVYWTYTIPRTGLSVREREVNFELDEYSDNEKPIEILNETDGPMTVKLETDAPEFNVDQSVTIDPHSSQKVRVSFTPNSLRGTTGNLSIGSTSGPVGRVCLRGQFSLVTSLKVIPFFGMQEGQKQTVKFSVAGAPKIKVELPSWLTGPLEVDNMRSVTVTCAKLPSAVCSACVLVSAENMRPVHLPVIGYRGSSDVQWSVTRNNAVRVENKGMRTAFVVFSCGQETKVRPSYGILLPRKTATFHVELHGESSVTINYGDEILRQVYSELFEDEMYEELHEHVLRDEIGPIRGILDNLDAEDFAQLFRDSVASQEIEFHDAGSGNGLFELSTLNLDFGKVDPKKLNEKSVWLENLTMTPLEVRLSSDCDFLYFPERIRMKSEERVLVSVEMDGIQGQFEINGAIKFHVGESEQHLNVHGIVCEENDDFEAEILNFGNCEIGRLNRGILKLTNKKSRGSSVRISVNTPFSTPNKEVYVESKSFIYISIHFLPQKRGQFHEYIRFDPDISRTFSVPVMGSAGFR